jgi:hypothetical protein
MTVIESIVRGVQRLPLRDQVEVARYVHRLNSDAEKEHASILRRTHGALSQMDGEAFEQALDNARRVGKHG